MFMIKTRYRIKLVFGKQREKFIFKQCLTNLIKTFFKHIVTDNLKNAILNSTNKITNP